MLENYFLEGVISKSDVLYCIVRDYFNQPVEFGCALDLINDIVYGEVGAGVRVLKWVMDHILHLQILRLICGCLWV